MVRGRLEAELVENKITFGFGVDLHSRKSVHNLRIRLILQIRNKVGHLGGVQRKWYSYPKNQGDKCLWCLCLFLGFCFVAHFEVMKQFIILERLSVKFNVDRSRWQPEHCY